MTIAQFFRVNGGSTQLRGVTPDIKFPVTGDFDQNGEQSYDNALPWTSIPSADFKPAGDPTTLLPLLEARHAKRAASDKEWQALQADITDVRKLRAETTISLNEAARRAERDEQEAKRHERHPETVAAAVEQSSAKVRATPDSPEVKRAAIDASSTVITQSSKKIASAEDRRAADPDAVNQVATVGSSNAAKTAKRGDASHQDDGLQADERSLKSELDEEKKRKAEKDVILNETAHILADEVELLRADTKLAARVLPHGTTGWVN